MEDRRSPSHPQLPQSRDALDAAVGTLDAAADYIALAERLGILLAPSCGQPSLLGRMYQTVLPLAFFNRTLSIKVTWAARRFRHHRRGLSRVLIRTDVSGV